jgi:hypothetical protein
MEVLMMGLDTYAVLPQRDANDQYVLAPKEAFAHIPPVLVGGFFSGHGDAPSFRGKIYDRYVTTVTGKTLYQTYIPPDKVKVMADKLSAVLEDHPDSEFIYGISCEEAKALAEWFRVCADNGYAVVGWW